MSGRVRLTPAQWKAIHRDFKGMNQDGTRSAFAGALPKGLTTETGTTLVLVEVVRETKTRYVCPEGHACRSSGDCVHWDYEA